MFDSPLEWCRVCKDWVALDQSRAECAREHGCEPATCPLARVLRGESRQALPPDRGLELR